MTHPAVHPIVAAIQQAAQIPDGTAARASQDRGRGATPCRKPGAQRSDSAARQSCKMYNCTTCDGCGIPTPAWGAEAGGRAGSPRLQANNPDVRRHAPATARRRPGAEAGRGGRAPGAEAVGLGPTDAGSVPQQGHLLFQRAHQVGAARRPHKGPRAATNTQGWDLVMLQVAGRKQARVSKAHTAADNADPQPHCTPPYSPHRHLAWCMHGVHTSKGRLLSTIYVTTRLCGESAWLFVYTPLRPLAPTTHLHSWWPLLGDQPGLLRHAPSSSGSVLWNA